MSEEQKIRVVIADDQELVRAGFAMVIGSQPDMAVAAQARDGAEAVALAETLHPDVVLMDVRMPGMDGIEATRQISALQHRFAADGTQSEVTHTKVIILTTFDLDEYVMAAITAGASGFLLKDTEPETLLNSIRTVFQGNAIIAPSATKRLIEKMMEGDFMAANVGRPENSATTSTTDSTYTDPELDDLTDREREVLIEIAHGLSNQEIADKLFISLPTGKTHYAHLLAKINTRDRVQAVVVALENHLVWLSLFFGYVWYAKRTPTMFVAGVLFAVFAMKLRLRRALQQEACSLPCVRGIRWRAMLPRLPRRVRCR